ncbi:hypothetical protein DL767_000438 [Monosporascus sp. MG133]|nr:hypothetical protein DL767_000438 [Monosporascus sp. MG133]
MPSASDSKAAAEDLEDDDGLNATTELTNFKSPMYLHINGVLPHWRSRRLFTQRGRLPQNKTQDIISQVVDGLHSMHVEGFAHRDLKPGNILIKSHPPTDHWWVKICDFGLSKRIEDAEGGSAAVKGTPGFLAPELLGFGGGDPRKSDPYAADIWCLGEMTFRLLTRKAAFPSLALLGNYVTGTVTSPTEALREVEASETVISFVKLARAAGPRDRVRPCRMPTTATRRARKNVTPKELKDPKQFSEGPAISPPQEQQYREDQSRESEPS